MLIKTRVLIALSHTSTRGVEYIDVEILTKYTQYFDVTEVYHLLSKQYPLLFSLSNDYELELSKYVCSVNIATPIKF